MSKDIRCGTCRLYEPVRGETGRVRPSEGGYCRWVPPNPKQSLPWSLIYRARLLGELMNARARVFAGTGAMCECWEPKK